MIPIGYLAKRIQQRPDWLKSDRILDVYSVSNHVSRDFDDYIPYWKHNGYWLFDSPEIIIQLSVNHSIDLKGSSLFYYEAYDQEYDSSQALWRSVRPEDSLPTNVMVPKQKVLEGYDVATYSTGACPECSPLSCNALADELITNQHCLLPSFQEAISLLTSGMFAHAEPGPYRIIAVYSVDWP
jgi:hypothetical protein